MQSISSARNPATPRISQRRSQFIRVFGKISVGSTISQAFLGGDEGEGRSTMFDVKLLGSAMNMFPDPVWASQENTPFKLEPTLKPCPLQSATPLQCLLSFPSPNGMMPSRKHLLWGRRKIGVIEIWKRLKGVCLISCHHQVSFHLSFIWLSCLYHIICKGMLRPFSNSCQVASSLLNMRLLDERMHGAFSHIFLFQHINTSTLSEFIWMPLSSPGYGIPQFNALST